MPLQMLVIVLPCCSASLEYGRPITIVLGAHSAPFSGHKAKYWVEGVMKSVCQWILQFPLPLHAFLINKNSSKSHQNLVFSFTLTTRTSCKAATMRPPASTHPQKQKKEKIKKQIERENTKNPQKNCKKWHKSAFPGQWAQSGGEMCTPSLGWESRGWVWCSRCVKNAQTHAADAIFPKKNFFLLFFGF